jgi:excinuclease ABC subunit B
VQTIGRAARNLNGTAILYADRITGSMRRAIDETDRRRATQAAYNAEHGIEPRSIQKSVEQIRFTTAVADVRTPSNDSGGARVAEKKSRYSRVDAVELVEALEQEMKEAAAELDFERAARLRDQIFEVRTQMETSP